MNCTLSNCPTRSEDTHIRKKEATSYLTFPFDFNLLLSLFRNLNTGISLVVVLQYLVCICRTTYRYGQRSCFVSSLRRSSLQVTSLVEGVTPFSPKAQHTEPHHHISIITSFERVMRPHFRCFPSRIVDKETVSTG